MNALEWKCKSGPLYTRLIELQFKAEDSGLTTEEQEEYVQLKQETEALFSQFLRSCPPPAPPLP